MGNLGTYHDWLGVSRTATAEQIREAYRCRVFVTRPDKGGNSENFQMERKAYSVLSDPQKKKAYDKSKSVYSIHTQSALTDSIGVSVSQLALGTETALSLPNIPILTALTIDTAFDY